MEHRAGELAADLARFLNDEPVSAAPLTATYRLRKFVARNKLAVLAAGLVLSTLIVTPFAFGYDWVMTLLPICYLIRGKAPWWVVFALWLAPVLHGPAMHYGFMFGPIALLLGWIALSRKAYQEV